MLATRVLLELFVGSNKPSADPQEVHTVNLPAQTGLRGGGAGLAAEPGAPGQALVKCRCLVMLESSL